MKEEFLDFNSTLHQHWLDFIHKIPAIILALIILLVGFFIIKYVSKYARTIIEQRANDSIVTKFLVNIISIILTVFLVSISLGILGFGNITDKLLAGTAITTFIVGYALKDIGENFLAGILMAFRRPFRIGDLIEVQKIRGRVKEMSLRETNIQTLDGKDVFIPNSIILKNPLENFTYHQLLRSEFVIDIAISEDIEKIMADLLTIINTFEEVEKQPKANASIIDIEDNKIKLKCSYWFKTTDVTAPGNSLKSEILIKTIRYFKNQKINLIEETEEEGSATSQNTEEE